MRPSLEEILLLMMKYSPLKMDWGLYLLLLHVAVVMQVMAKDIRLQHLPALDRLILSVTNFYRKEDHNYKAVQFLDLIPSKFRQVLLFQNSHLRQIRDWVFLKQ